MPTTTLDPVVPQAMPEADGVADALADGLAAPLHIVIDTMAEVPLAAVAAALAAPASPASADTPSTPTTSPTPPTPPTPPTSPLATAGHAANVKAAAPAPAKRSRPPQRDGKILGQPAFVLHSYPYKETSLIIDLFTRDHGRVALVAKGAKRPHSQLRGVLQTFQPLSTGWSGKSELRVLTGAEWVGGMLPLEKTALLCGFYLNELLVKLLARDDPHPKLFDHYVATLNQLAHHEPAPIVLRKFERALLKETGVSVDLARCTATRQAVLPAQLYVVDPERGPRPERAADSAARVCGKTLLDMEREDYSDATTQAQSKQLMRFLLAHHLGGAPLNTRQILIDLMQL